MTKANRAAGKGGICSYLSVDASPEVCDRSVDIRIVADDKSGIVDRNRHLVETGKELAKRWRRSRQRLRAAIDRDQLAAGIADHPAPEEAAVVRLVVQDVLVTPRRVGAMAGASVVEAPIGIDPEDELWSAMGQITNRTPSAAESLGKEIEHL